MNYKFVKILNWITKEPFDLVVFYMKTRLHLLDEQVIYHFEILKKEKLIKYSKYRYRITLKGRMYLLNTWFKKFMNAKYNKKGREITINEDFYNNYLPKEVKMLE